MSTISPPITRMAAVSDASAKGRPSFILASSVAEAALVTDVDLSKEKINDLAPLPIMSIRNKPLGVSSLLTPKTLTATELKALEETAEVEAKAPPLKQTAPKQVGLFIGDLARSVTEAEIAEVFQEYGQIDVVDIKRDKFTQNNLGYGFIKYRTHEQARAAKVSLDGLVLGGRAIRLGWAQKNTTLFIGDLDGTVTTEMLREAFGKFGELDLNDTSVAPNGKFGFVRFRERFAAENAKNTMSRKKLGSRPLRIGWGDNKTEKHCVHVQFSPKSAPITEDVLTDLFAEFGDIYSVAIPRFNAKTLKGFAFIHFEESTEGEFAASAAISACSDKVILLDPLKRSEGGKNPSTTTQISATNDKEDNTETGEGAGSSASPGEAEGAEKAALPVEADTTDDTASPDTVESVDSSKCDAATDNAGVTEAVPLDNDAAADNADTEAEVDTDIKSTGDAEATSEEPKLAFDDSSSKVKVTLRCSYGKRQPYLRGQNSHSKSSRRGRHTPQPQPYRTQHGYHGNGYHNLGYVQANGHGYYQPHSRQHHYMQQGMKPMVTDPHNQMMNMNMAMMNMNMYPQVYTNRRGGEGRSRGRGRGRRRGGRGRNGRGGRGGGARDERRDTKGGRGGRGKYRGRGDRGRGRSHMGGGMMRPRLDSDLSDVDDLMYQNSLLLQKVYSPYVYAASRHGSIDATGMTPPHGRSFQHLSPVSPLHLPQQPPSNGQAGYYISQQGDLISDRSISPVPMYANYSHSPHHVQSGQYYLHSPTSSEVMAMPAGGYIPSGQAMGYDK